VREWTPTLSSELSLGELESQRTPKSSKSDYMGQNSLHWRVLYIIGKLLELRCLKWVSMTHFEHLKVRNHPDFLAFRCCATLLKRFQQGLQLCFRPHLNWRFYTQSYGPPKLWKTQFREFRNSNLGIPRQNDIWVLVPWLGTENTIRGKVVASPKSGPW
jgi:hypothetical protein